MTASHNGEPAPAGAGRTAGARVARAHACFLLEARFPLETPRTLEAHELWRCLSYRVMREPRDLLAHARRVLLCRRGELVERLPGALLDLAHVTGARALPLRRRLFEVTRHRLRARDRAFFAAALDGTLPAGSTPPDVAGRVLPTFVDARRSSGERDPDEQAPDGRTPDGRTPDGRTPDGRTPGGRTPGGRPPDGRPPDGRPLDP